MRAPRPVFLPAFAALAGVAVLLSLGFWQLERAEWRRGQDAERELRRQLTPVYIAHFPAAGLAELDGRRVRLRGRYRERQFLLDNRMRGRRPGYQVLTPLELAGHGQVILVDRGWIARGASRARPPAAPAPVGDLLQVAGTLRRPAANPLTDRAHLFERESWPQVAQDLDYPRMAARLGELELVPAVLRLGPDEPHGYARDWPAPPMTAARHAGYAAQWFALAGLLALLFGLYWLRARRAAAAD